MLRAEPSVRVAVVVLAAGSGRRLGLGPKAHVMLGEMTFLSRILRACHDARLGQAYVVRSLDDDRLAPLGDDSIHGGLSIDSDAVPNAPPMSVRVVTNEDPARGMSSSVHEGLAAAARDGAAGVLVFPVDIPLVHAATLRLLAATIEGQPGAWARPLFDGKGGHPVALGALLVRRVLARGPATPLRDALREEAAPAIEVACDDAGVLEDIDLPDDLARARGLL